MNRPHVDRRPPKASVVLRLAAWQRGIRRSAVGACVVASMVAVQGPAAAQTVVLDDGFESYPVGLLGSQG